MISSDLNKQQTRESSAELHLTTARGGGQALASRVSDPRVSIRQMKITLASPIRIHGRLRRFRSVLSSVPPSPRGLQPPCRAFTSLVPAPDQRGRGGKQGSCGVCYPRSAMDEVTRAYLQSVRRGTEAEEATQVPCRGRWRDAVSCPRSG